MASGESERVQWRALEAGKRAESALLLWRWHAVAKRVQSQLILLRLRLPSLPRENFH
jgi:hypothetical protein